MEGEEAPEAFPKIDCVRSPKAGGGGGENWFMMVSFCIIGSREKRAQVSAQERRFLSQPHPPSYTFRLRAERSSWPRRHAGAAQSSA